MEFNSRLDDKITACGENQKWQSVTPQYRFNFQKFSDFLRARTQNVHSVALYYEKSTKILGVDNGNFRRTIRNGANVNAAIEECGTSGITPLLYMIDHTSIFDINKRRQNEY